MIFDLLSSTKGHQFDPRMKILLAFCSARHPRRFDMPHDLMTLFENIRDFNGHPGSCDALKR